MVMPRISPTTFSRDTEDVTEGLPAMASVTYARSDIVHASLELLFLRQAPSLRQEIVPDRPQGWRNIRTDADPIWMVAQVFRTRQPAISLIQIKRSGLHPHQPSIEDGGMRRCRGDRHLRHQGDDVQGQCIVDACRTIVPPHRPADPEWSATISCDAHQGQGSLDQGRSNALDFCIHCRQCDLLKILYLVCSKFHSMFNFYNCFCREKTHKVCSPACLNAS